MSCPYSKYNEYDFFCELSNHSRININRKLNNSIVSRYCHGNFYNCPYYKTVGNIGYTVDEELEDSKQLDQSQSSFSFYKLIFILMIAFALYKTFIERRL